MLTQGKFLGKGQVNYRMDRNSKVNTETLEEEPDGERNKIVLDFKRPNGEKPPKDQFTMKSLCQNNCPICVAYKILLKPFSLPCLTCPLPLKCARLIYSTTEGPEMFPFYEGAVFWCLDTFVCVTDSHLTRWSTSYLSSLQKLWILWCKNSKPLSSANEELLEADLGCFTSIISKVSHMFGDYALLKVFRTIYVQ